MSGYCTVDDVSAVLQDDFAGANPSTSEVKAAIDGQNEWLRRRTRNHWYDSTAGSDADSTNDFLFTSAISATDVRESVPSSPHRQDRQLFSDAVGVRYPVTHAGPYARIRLPHFNVQSLTKLEVRERDGDVTDWVAASDKVAGRGEDYYLHVDGDEFGASYLYIRADSIGGRVDFTDLLTLAYDYGVDGNGSELPDTITRTVALRAAAELVLDDDMQAGIPNDGQLVALESKADSYRKEAERLLGEFTQVPVA